MKLTWGQSPNISLTASIRDGRLILHTPRSRKALLCRAEKNFDENREQCHWVRREALTLGLGSLVSLAVMSPNVEAAEGLPDIPGFPKQVKGSARRRKIPESEYKEGPEGLKYYDIEVGKGQEAKPGARVAVHYDAKWKGVTFMTSRQGMGVTGGTPLGFDIGAKREGGTLRGLDLGVRGMRIGGQRKLIVPPELAYGKKGIGEIPPDATLDIDVQLLSIKTNSFGYQTKLVEG